MKTAVVQPGFPFSNWRLCRAHKFVAADGFAFLCSLSLAVGLRHDFLLPPDILQNLIPIAFWVLAIKVVIFYFSRQFHILPDFFGVSELRRLFVVNACSSVVLAVVPWSWLTGYAMPRSVFAIDFLISTLFLTGLRVTLRLRRERMRSVPVHPGKPVRRVGIIGAGEAGAILARELLTKRGRGLEPVVFFDDDRRKWNVSVHSVPVAGCPEILLGGGDAKWNLDEVVISMPSAPAKRLQEVISILQQVKLPFRTVPSLTELALGKVQISQLRPIEFEDVLGRPAIELETESIRCLLEGMTVMVTGAGGSIGSELCRQILRYDPAELLLVERSEVAVFAVEQELISLHPDGRIQPLVADILDKPRMKGIFKKYRPHIVFHAAAHKHVPMMERQPAEAIRNNSLGTALLAELAIEFGVGRFVLISTDKAINPTSVMGATKRLAEVFLQSVHAANPKATRMMAVRFGNVLGSSGSVIPIFKKQIAAGGPITVTHPDVTRYFMTIPEAVGLVLQSAVQGQGGEIFVLDMGKPVKIVDLARKLIELSGLEPDTDISIKFVGLRPGEKLFEELNLNEESLSPTSHPKIMRLRAEAQSLASVRAIIQQFSERMYLSDSDDMKHLLRQAIPEYTPSLSQRVPTVPVRQTIQFTDPVSTCAGN